MLESARSILLRHLEEMGISEPAVLDAIAAIPRDAFISGPGLKARAYEDTALSIECGQTISQPFIVAYMTERLQVNRHHDVLEVGTGSGYQTAILSILARRVFTVERHLNLHEAATARFRMLGLTNIEAIDGNGCDGWPWPRKFDRIMITAGTFEIPRQVSRQLGPFGKLIAPVGAMPHMRLTLISNYGEKSEIQKLMPVRFVPLVCD